MRKAQIFMFGVKTGILIENENGYMFSYSEEYLTSENAVSITLTLPLRSEPYKDKVLFPFFDGLIPEGWLLDIAVDNWKLDPRDRMGLLLACCKECIGAVSVIAILEEF